jgi:hypothetical protein
MGGATLLQEPLRLLERQRTASASGLHLYGNPMGQGVCIEIITLGTPASKSTEGGLPMFDRLRGGPSLRHHL